MVHSFLTINMLRRYGYMNKSRYTIQSLPSPFLIQRSISPHLSCLSIPSLSLLALSLALFSSKVSQSIFSTLKMAKRICWRSADWKDGSY
ncbi:hypothetical protein L2E82_32222 [Cichorium intybus]|uniref:Uncharacterized protein n=1 Tax=Cichorium intybus TaxID=13427 RepID=A0ACB9BHE1_CICIN|nr:hypothetical protein L2E82_32222 [Cichorium intybus]